jgi:LmbE family N-acetylglucosaminyl deacetylase
MRQVRQLFISATVAGVLMSAGLIGQETANDAGRFTFQDDRSRAITVTLAKEGDGIALTWPPSGTEPWDTALLATEVSVDAGTRAPFLEIVSGDRTARQHFASGESGARWINLSFLSGSVGAGTQVTLRGEGVTVAPGEAALRMFSSSPDLTKTILVLAPHPDDAEIAAFGLYANRKATVVTVTAGNAGAPTYESVFDDPVELYWFKGRIRLIDSITVPWQGGIPPERAFNMGYFDARLAEMYDRKGAVVPEMYRPNSDINLYRRDNIGTLLPKRSRESTWTNLVDDVETIVRKVKPSIIVAPHPQLDTHRDHQYTSVALAEALARWKKPVTLLLYTNHADRNRYPYGPAGTIMSLPPAPGRDVALDQVYSHPVAPALQRLKLFALESMHDLRFSPTRQYQLAIDDDRTGTPEKPGPEPDITYLRRGPRSNELFYVYDERSFQPMVARFLAGRGDSRQSVGASRQSQSVESSTVHSENRCRQLPCSADSPD